MKNGNKTSENSRNISSPLNKTIVNQINKLTSNPIFGSSSNQADKTGGSGIVAKINVLGKGMAQLKMPRDFIHNTNEAPSGAVDYAGFIKEINEITGNVKDKKECFSAFHDLFVNRFSCAYTALGLVSANQDFIGIRLLDKNSNVYSLKVFMKQEDNEIVKAVKNLEPAFYDNSSFLKLPAFDSLPSLIIPVSICGKCICVMAVSDSSVQSRQDLYRLAASNLGLLVQYDALSGSANEIYIDPLTNLCSHRRFHELLAQEIETAKRNKTKVSVVIFDINDMGQINREFGHSRGDDVIRITAEKIHEGIKKQDIAARYGGDEIAVILKNTGAEDAKYTAEYLAYSLSCCQADDIGYINRVSAGIAVYPDDSEDKDKLLILAEQAVLVSKTRGCTNGRTAIVSAQDYDFWDDTALSSFAAVMAKRHAQLGINFEDALVERFQSENIMSQSHLIEIVTSLAGAIDAKDKYTKDHSSSVSRYSAALAKAIGLSDKETERIKLGALLHDIGKIGIPEYVLNKPDRLTEEEFNIIKQHPVIAVKKILEPNPILHDLIPIIKYHHEQWNGKGYPDGLKGEEIPLEARIAAIADTYHALISDRPYRKGMSAQKACKILEEGAGVQWDKDLVRQFIAIAPSLAVKV